VIRGLEAGVRRAITAKLRECGMSEEAAARLAEERLKEAVTFFGGRLSTYQLHGKPLEPALDQSFVDLARWAATLLASLQEDAAAPHG